MSNWVTGDPRAGSQTVRRITSEQNANNLWPAVGQQMTAEEGKRWRALCSTPLHPSIHPSTHPPLLATVHSGWLIDRGKPERSVVEIIQLCQNCVTCYGLCVLSIAATVTMWHVVWIRAHIKVKWYLFKTSHSRLEYRIGRRGDWLRRLVVFLREVDSVCRLFPFLPVLFFLILLCSLPSIKWKRGPKLFVGPQASKSTYPHTWTTEQFDCQHLPKRHIYPFPKQRGHMTVAA